MGMPIRKIGDILVLNRLNRCHSTTNVKGALSLIKEIYLLLLLFITQFFIKSFFAQQSPFCLDPKCTYSLFLRWYVSFNVWINKVATVRISRTTVTSCEVKKPHQSALKFCTLAYFNFDLKDLTQISYLAQFYSVLTQYYLCF